MINKYALGTIVGTALLGLTKKHAGSSIRLKNLHQVDYTYYQGFFYIDTNELPFDMSNYTITFDENGIANEEVVYEIHDAIYRFLSDIQHNNDSGTALNHVINEAFGIREGEHISVSINTEEDANWEYISSRTPYFIDENGRIKHWAVELNFTYTIETLDEKIIPNSEEVEYRLEDVFEEIISFISSRFGITLIQGMNEAQLVFNSQYNDTTIVFQNKEGALLYYKPKSPKSKLRKR